MFTLCRFFNSVVSCRIQKLMKSSAKVLFRCLLSKLSSSPPTGTSFSSVGYFHLSFSDVDDYYFGEFNGGFITI